MTNFSNPFQTQKLFIFFITQSEKHTSAKFVRFKSYIKFIFWGPQQQWFGKSHGATGYLNMESVHQYLH